MAQVTPFKDRTCIVHSSGPPSDPDEEDYEYMNKQTAASRAAAKLPGAPLKDSGSWVQMKDLGGHPPPREDRDALRGSSTEDRASLEYEYMDIRGSEGEESLPLQKHEAPPRTAAPENVSREVLQEVEEEDDYQEAEDNYQYTNRQPKLRQALEQRKEGTGPGRGQREPCEYEDMNSLSGERGADEMAVYQNLAGGEEEEEEEERAAGHGTEGLRASGIDPYVKVRAGAAIGEPGGVDRSFDNPDYWHSRMFLKSNAVRT